MKKTLVSLALVAGLAIAAPATAQADTFAPAGHAPIVSGATAPGTVHYVVRHRHYQRFGIFSGARIVWMPRYPSTSSLTTTWTRCSVYRQYADRTLYLCYKSGNPIGYFVWG